MSRQARQMPSSQRVQLYDRAQTQVMSQPVWVRVLVQARVLQRVLANRRRPNGQ